MAAVAIDLNDLADLSETPAPEPAPAPAPAPPSSLKQTILATLVVTVIAAAMGALFAIPPTPAAPVEKSDSAPGGVVPPRGRSCSRIRTDRHQPRVASGHLESPL